MRLQQGYSCGQEGCSRNLCHAVEGPVQEGPRSRAAAVHIEVAVQTLQLQADLSDHAELASHMSKGCRLAWGEQG